MSLYVKPRKERPAAVDYESQIKEVRLQLVDQLKVLDMQLDQKTQQLQDLSDYLRRRGEIEGDYARSLDRLADRFTSKTRRKEPNGQTVAQAWLSLLTQTRQESKAHNGLSESCTNLLSQPLTNCLECTQRMAKRSKEVCSQLQDGLLKVTTELQTAWKTYYQYHTEYVSADGKLKDAEKMEEKQKQNAAKKVERLIEKRQGKVQEIHLKCTKARNDYLLNLAAANTSMSKYYLQDISTLINCADAGYHLSLSRVMRAYLSSHSRAQQNVRDDLQQLQVSVLGLDQNRDRDFLLQTHNNTFCLPLRFQYHPHDGDQVCEVSAESQMRSELETRFHQLQSRLASVTQETEEAEKNMLATHSSLLESVSDDDLEPSNRNSSSGDDSSENLANRSTLTRRRANLQETEALYFTKVKEYLTGSSLVSKLQAKHDLLKVAIEKAKPSNYNQRRQNTVRVRRSPSSAKFTQKLFSADILSFIKISEQEIPVVMESCIRFINLNGLHHEGIFRVPGSQAEVKNLRDAFEKGEDPLEEKMFDIDSVAGVLKLYFRSQMNPLFPHDSISQLLECAQIDNETERANSLKAVISSYPPPVIVVMRYLFAFLHHVSQYSDENMMQPYNLAVCFGPSLVRSTNDDDLVTLQPQINALVKDIIFQHESIFPSQAELQGPVYEKCMTLDHHDCDPIAEEGDGETEHFQNKCELDTEVSMDQSIRLPAANCSPANSKGSLDASSVRLSPIGGGIGLVGRLNLQLPMGPQGRRPPPRSPGFSRNEPQDRSSAEDIPVQVDKEVCQQMNSVFKELLTRHSPQDPSALLASQHSQKKGGNIKKGKGLF